MTGEQIYTRAATILGLDDRDLTAEQKTAFDRLAADARAEDSPAGALASSMQHERYGF